MPTKLKADFCAADRATLGKGYKCRACKVNGTAWTAYGTEEYVRKSDILLAKGLSELKSAKRFSVGCVIA